MSSRFWDGPNLLGQHLSQTQLLAWSCGRPRARACRASAGLEEFVQRRREVRQHSKPPEGSP